MSWPLIAVYLATIGPCWSLTELETECIRNYNEDFNNDLLLGTWYQIRYFIKTIKLLPTTECQYLKYEKPNSSEIRRYQEEYSKPDAPYSVLDNPIHEYGGYHRPPGFLVGHKQAKFIILDPRTYFYRYPYSVRIYKRINDEFLLYNECDSRMEWWWLLSRTRNPLQEKVDAAISNLQELRDMTNRTFCVPDDGPFADINQE